MTKQTQTALPHNIIMESRKSLRISGVKDIDSFTENRVILDTVMGELVIKGNDLHVNTLEAQTGDFYMTGEINSLSYTKGSLLENPVRRLFK